MRIDRNKGDWGYIWPEPFKDPKRFHISLHWPNRCSTTKWWGRLSSPNAFNERSRGYHSHLPDRSSLCKSLCIYSDAGEVTVVDEGVEYQCVITKMFRRTMCEFIVLADVI